MRLQERDMTTVWFADAVYTHRDWEDITGMCVDKEALWQSKTEHWLLFCFALTVATVVFKSVKLIEEKSEKKNNAAEVWENTQQSRGSSWRK